MGKKYLVKIGRLERLYKASVNAHGKPNITWLSPEVDLTPYTEPDLEAVRKEAYEEGFKDGQYAERNGLTASYEQEQEEIKVGDEVAIDAGNRASVLYENPDGTQVFVFKSDGTAAWWTKSALHRTGRNFPEIAAVLEKMREGQE